MGFASPLPKRRPPREPRQPRPQADTPIPNKAKSFLPSLARLALRSSITKLIHIATTTGHASDTMHQGVAVVPAKDGPTAPKTSAKDLLLHVLLKKPIMDPKAKATTALARSVLNAVALTSPSIAAAAPPLQSDDPIVDDALIWCNAHKDGINADELALIHGDVVKTVHDNARTGTFPRVHNHRALSRADTAYHTPVKARKRALSAPLTTPSPENIKRSQIVNDEFSRNSLDTSDEEAFGSTTTAPNKIPKSETEALAAKHRDEKRAWEKHIEALKGKHEEEIVSLRREHETRLNEEKRKASQDKKLKEMFQEFTTRDEERWKLVDSRLGMAGVDLRALHPATSTTQQPAPDRKTHASKIQSSNDPDPGLSDGQRKILPLPARKVQQPQEQQSQQQADSAADSRLADIIHERDQLQQYNEVLESQKQHLQAKVQEYKGLFEDRDLKLSDLRIEQGDDVVRSSDKDKLLQGKAARYGDLVREHNDVIGQNSKLQQKLEDMESTKNEEIESLTWELNEYKANERSVLKSRNRHKRAATRMIQRLRYKMTAGDVKEMTACAWWTAKKDNKKLCDKVIWLRKILKACNDVRLQTHKKGRIMMRIYDKKNRENEELLKLKRDSQLQIEALQWQTREHIPGCKGQIANRDVKIKTLEVQKEVAALRHQKQIMAGADKGPIMLIEELQESNNMRQRLIDQQIKTIKELEESAGAKFYSMQRELSMMPEYIEWLEGFQARAYAAEEEVSNLRAQLDRGDENLADPRNWEHHRICSEWKAEAKVVIDEYVEKKKKTLEIVKGLWERLRDFEFQARFLGLKDPDIYVGEDRRGNIKKGIRDLFMFNIDKEVGRRIHESQLEPDLRSERVENDGEKNDVSASEGEEEGEWEDGESSDENTEEDPGDCESSSDILDNLDGDDEPEQVPTAAVDEAPDEDAETEHRHEESQSEQPNPAQTCTDNEEVRNISQGSKDRAARGSTTVAEFQDTELSRSQAHKNSPLMNERLEELDSF